MFSTYHKDNILCHKKERRNGLNATIFSGTRRVTWSYRTMPQFVNSLLISFVTKSFCI